MTPVMMMRRAPEKRAAQRAGSYLIMIQPEKFMIKMAHWIKWRKSISRILFSITLTMILTACSSSASVTPATQTLPVLIMDDAHFQDKNTVYEIPAGNGFILDSQNYTFKVPANAGPVIANYVQLAQVDVNGEVYGMEWQSAESSHAITNEQLQPLSGAKAFDGFKTGQEVVIAVGNMNEGHFTPLWTATIDVK